jgi:hypothetical protein
MGRHILGIALPLSYELGNPAQVFGKWSKNYGIAILLAILGAIFS